MGGWPPLKADGVWVVSLACGLTLGESLISSGSGGNDVGIAILM